MAEDDHPPRRGSAPLAQRTPLSGPPGPQRWALAAAVLGSAMVAAWIGARAGGAQATPVVAMVIAFGIGLTFALTRRAVNGQVAQSTREFAASGRDRAVLEAAAANDGWVTPAMVVRCVRDMSLDEAKATLERCLHAGHCSMDSNDEGQVYYHFAIGGKPGQHVEVSPEEWVEQTARLLGPAGEQSEDVDAR